MHVQAGEAVAFFVGRNGSSDGVDSFVTSVLNAGFGSGGEAAQIEVLQRIFQVCMHKISLACSRKHARGKKRSYHITCCTFFVLPMF